MRIVVGIVIGLIVIIGVVFAVGLALPRDHGGASVTVTEAGYVKNALFRTMMKLMGVHKTADGYLTALGKKLGEAVKPEHVQ